MERFSLTFSELGGIMVVDEFKVPLFQIWVNDDFNCRQSITKESIEELAKSIKQEGLICPIVVQPTEELLDAPEGFRWRLVCGFRRYTACKHLGWETISVVVRKNLSIRDAQMINLNENLARKELNILEEALILEKLFPVYRTISSISKELNQSEYWINTRRKLLLLSPFIQKAAASGRLSAADLQVIQHALDPDDIAREILNASRDRKKYKIIFKGKHRKSKTEVKELIVKMLDEGFHPNLLRFIAWTIGEVDDKALKDSLEWLRDRKGWLK